MDSTFCWLNQLRAGEIKMLCKWLSLKTHQALSLLSPAVALPQSLLKTMNNWYAIMFIVKIHPPRSDILLFLKTQTFGAQKYFGKTIWPSLQEKTGTLRPVKPGPSCHLEGPLNCTIILPAPKQNIIYGDLYLFVYT